MDTSTGEPLMNTTAMVRALSIYARLRNSTLSGAHSQASGCVPPGTIDKSFAVGECAMTIAWDVQFKVILLLSYVRDVNRFLFPS